MTELNAEKRHLHVAVLGLRGIPEVQGGIERHCQELYPRLSERGFDITLLARKGYVPGYDYEYRSVRVVPLWVPRRKNLEAFFHTFFGLLWLAHKSEKYDIIHIHGIGPSLLAPLARFFGSRLVVTNHGPDYDRKKWGWLAKRMLRLGERFGTRHAHVTIAVSKLIKKQLYEKYGSTAIYVPNGIIASRHQTDGKLLEKYGLSSGVYFLAVGRLVPEKGFHDLLEAYARLDTDWKLAIVGKADHDNAYSRRLKRSAEAIDGAVMTGFLNGEKLAEMYRHSGLLILPSYHEGLPIVALEAISYGLPLLASDIPANREIASPQEMFPVGNVDMLSRKMQSFLKEPSSLIGPAILEEKRKRLEVEFNWDVIADRTAEIYREISIMAC